MRIFQLSLGRGMIAVAATAVILSFPTCLLNFYMFICDTTRYSSGYSESSFSSVHIGMPQHEVLCRLGQPLRIVDRQAQTFWYYVRAGLSVSDDGGISGLSTSSSSNLTIFRADKKGRVVWVNGGLLGTRSRGMIGLTLIEVQRLFGDPSKKIIISAKTFSYSESCSDGSYYVRSVGISDCGYVDNISSYYYFD